MNISHVLQYLATTVPTTQYTPICRVCCNQLYFG
uniref:Uncharacterized protein n=1 Tax=Arundo donax TaxID=35708 RepID=A0A0A8ZR22_ARUDO